MGFLIGIAAKLVGERFAGIAAYAFIGALLIGALLWLRADAYSDGAAATDAKWVAAGERLKNQAAGAAAAAGKESDVRVAAEVERVRDEKEKLDEAESQGSSPLDVLFGA